MAYESSYESGRQPFLPDTKRGYWGKPNDFIYAGLSLAFRIDLVSYYTAINSGVIALIPMLLLGLAFFIVPFMIMQSFMGQFSSSGFISAFRVSPLFKGIGYVTLIMNICVLACYSLYAVIPMVYMFASLQPTLPWSCEGFQTWAVNLTKPQERHLCNMMFDDNDTIILEGSGSGDNETDEFVNHHIPSVLYFTHLFSDTYFFDYTNVEFKMSWQLMLCVLILWTLIAWMVYKYFDTEKFGTLIRYSLWTIMGLLIFLLLRFSFIKGSGKAYHRTFVPTWHNLATSFFIIPVYGVSTFGSGWGQFITLSSYNKFNTNIVKSSWIIGFGQFFLTFVLSIFIKLSTRYFLEITQGNYYSYLDSIWTLYLSSGSVMVHMEWANMWSVLFFFMLFLAALLMMLIQLNSILRTILDEFISLREKKMKVAMTLIAGVTVCSFYFTSNHGTSYSTTLAADIFIAQCAINLLLVLVILWIYGRVRFQRDIEFMTGQRFSTWMVNILRFVTPLALLLCMFAGLLIAHSEHLYSHSAITCIAILCIAVPWLFIPGYALYQMSLSMGPIKIRFLRCCHPTDWFPVEIEHRKNYEEVVASPEIAKTFSELKEKDVVA